MTLTLDEQVAFGVLRDLARDQGDLAATNEFRDYMRKAVAVLDRVLASVDKARSGDCERCYVERARIVKLLNEQLLDESQTPRHATRFAEVRQMGYRAGWNDRARSLAKQLDGSAEEAARSRSSTVASDEVRYAICGGCGRDVVACTCGSGAV